MRRCWRFGQKQPVKVHIITADIEGAVLANIKRKEADAERMANEMVEHMQDLNAEALHGATVRQRDDYRTRDCYRRRLDAVPCRLRGRDARACRRLAALLDLLVRHSPLSTPTRRVSAIWATAATSTRSSSISAFS